MFLAVLAALVLAMSDHDEWEPPDDCVYEARAANRHVYDAELHGNLDTEDFELPQMGSAGPSRELSSRPPVYATQQGKYSRETSSKRLAHADQAAIYLERINAHALAGVCSHDCPHACAQRLSRNEMMGCIESSYGTIKWISSAALKVSAAPSSVPCSFLLANTHIDVQIHPNCPGREATPRSCLWQGIFRCRRHIGTVDHVSQGKTD